MEEISLIDPQAFNFLDYIKDTIPVSFIGLFLFLAGFFVTYLILIKYWRWLVDRINNHK